MLILTPKDLTLFVTTLVAICLGLSLTFFDPFKCILAQRQDHIIYQLFKSNYKLWTLILANLPVHASTDPPENVQKVAHTQGQ